jgi:hypothetical protein
MSAISMTVDKDAVNMFERENLMDRRRKITFSSDMSAHEPFECIPL